MNEIMKALYDFWSKFGIPAYAEDMVPSSAQVPFIRYSVTKGAAMQASVMTVFNYHNARLMGNVERAEIAGRIADAIPEGGTKIPLESGGFLILYRGSDFQTLYQDPEDFNVIGVRTSVEVYFYAM